MSCHVLCHLSLSFCKPFLRDLFHCAGARHGRERELMVCRITVLKKQKNKAKLIFKLNFETVLIYLKNVRMNDDLLMPTSNTHTLVRQR